MALIGAGRLAEALRRRPGDHAAAFRPVVDEVQRRAATEGMALLFPADASELAARDRRLAEGGFAP